MLTAMTQLLQIETPIRGISRHHVRGERLLSVVPSIRSALTSTGGPTMIRRVSSRCNDPYRFGAALLIVAFGADVAR
jgi:hypothetical protein